MHLACNKQGPAELYCECVSRNLNLLVEIQLLGHPMDVGR